MKKFKYPVLFCVILFTFLTACHRNDNFTTEKWLNGDGLQYPLRDNILDDLVKTHQLKGLNYKQVQHLLGDPDGKDSVSFYYQVIETFNNVYEHKHTKNLVLYMGKDSIITRFTVYDKTFKKNRTKISLLQFAW